MATTAVLARQRLNQGEYVTSAEIDVSTSRQETYHLVVTKQNPNDGEGDPQVQLLVFNRSNAENDIRMDGTVLNGTGTHAVRFGKLPNAISIQAAAVYGNVWVTVNRVTGGESVDLVGGIQTVDLADASVTTAKLADLNVTQAKQALNTTGLDNVIAAADGAAIPVTKSGSVAIVTGAGGETNTLAIPTFLGQQLFLNCDTHGGGDRVVTAASAINIAGNTVMTFGAARDNILLTAISIGGTLAWEVTINNNVVLS